MTRWRPAWLPLTVLVAATAALVASVWFTVSWADRADRTAAPACGPMMGWYAPRAAPVRDLDGAARAAQRYADRWQLRVGEVMQFSNGYYAVLLDGTGAAATEVLVDPDGTVRPECGPATMWNTRYGMRHHGRRAVTTGDATVTPDEAITLADRWLGREAPGYTAHDAVGFPGYYTLHIVAGDGRIAGMLSVHARSGEVWYHSWHGEFVRMRE